MDPHSLKVRTDQIATRARAKVRREAKRVQLQARHKMHGDYCVDYGWIRLPFSGDGDWQEVQYHLNQATWHDKDEQIFRSLVYPGATVIDVGANLGFVSAILSPLVGPSGRVISFEPSKRVFVKLERTITANGLQNVHPVNAGCGARRETLQLKAVGPSSGNASIVGDGPVLEQIDLVPLDEVETVWQHPVALIKIDTEGFEPQVLEGARRLIQVHRPSLYLEMGGDYITSTYRSIELLSEFDYDIRHVAGVEWAQHGNGTDLFFFPREGRP